MNLLKLIIILLLLGCANKSYEKIKVKYEVTEIRKLPNNQCQYIFQPKPNYTLIVPGECGLCNVGDTLIKTEIKR